MAGTWAGHERRSPGYRRILAALLLAGVATFAQLYSVQGVLPLLARDLRVGAATAALTVSAATIGLAVGALPWARAADRFGRLPVMKASLVSATAAGVLTPLMPGVGSVLTMRVVEGLALGGVPAIAVTYLAEEVHAAAAAVAAGTYVSGTTLGGLFGRIVAAPIAEAAGWRAGVLAVALLSAVAAVAFSLLAPAARGFARAPRDASSRGRLRAALRDPGLLVLYAQGFLLMGGFVAVYNYLSFRLEAPPFLLPVAVTALLFLAYLAGTVSSRVAGSLAAAHGRRRVLLGGTAAMLGGALLTLPDSLRLIVPGLVVLTAGFFAAHAIASGWVGIRAVRGRAQAASLYNLAYYAGSSLVGWGAGGLLALGWSALVGLVSALAVVAALLVVVDGRRGARGGRAKPRRLPGPRPGVCHDRTGRGSGREDR